MYGRCGVSRLRLEGDLDLGDRTVGGMTPLLVLILLLIVLLLLPSLLPLPDEEAGERRRGKGG